MRRMACWLLALALLVIPVRGEEARYVALTFDDGPSGRFTRRLLQGLEEREALATFFLCGYRLEQYPDLAGEILAGGHEIGLHGYSHSSMADMAPDTLDEELDRTAAILEAQTGTVSGLLRPPGGKTCDRVRASAAARGLSLVQWSVDPRDWATGDKARVVRQVVRDVQDGDIILLHDMSDSSVDAALEIVDALQAQGYQFVTVTRLSELRNRVLEAGACYRAFYP